MNYQSKTPQGEDITFSLDDVEERTQHCWFLKGDIAVFPPATTTKLPTDYDFQDTMKALWAERGLVPNPALEATWLHIKQAIDGVVSSNTSLQWSEGKKAEIVVIPAPTGAGKTSALQTYLKCCTDLPTSLIVVRTQATADSLANELCQILGEGKAVSHHSRNRQEDEDLLEAPILVICHAAYEKALHDEWEANLWGKTSKAFDIFLTTTTGSRSLVVIDEEFELVGTASVSHLDTDKTAGLNLIFTLPTHIQLNFIEEFEFFVEMAKLLEASEGSKKGSLADILAHSFRSNSILYQPIKTTIEEYISELRLVELRDAVRDLSVKDFANNLDIAQEQARVKRLKTLQTLSEFILLQQSENTFTAKTGKVVSLNTATSIIPKAVRSVVVLDATAELNPVYEAVEEVELINLPKGSRNYSNLTLHIARSNTGKNSLTSTPRSISDSTKFLSKLVDVVGHPEDTLVIAHKEVSERLGKSKTFKAHSAYWGIIDGSNEWRDCSKVVIYGLNHKGDLYYARRRSAFNSNLEDWHEEEIADLSTELTQALARGNIRKPIDKEGNCAKCDAYVVLPRGHKGDAILNNLLGQFPKAEVEKWVLPTNTKKQTMKPNERKFLNKIKKLKEKASFAECVAWAGLTKMQGETIKKAVENTNSALFKALSAEGIEVIISGTKVKRVSLRPI